MPSPKKKVTLYFSGGMLTETQEEAIRQDRSISWIIQAAWRIAREEVRRLPDNAASYSGQRIDVGPSSSSRQTDSLKSPSDVS